jgi:hypothetical protein
MQRRFLYEFPCRIELNVMHKSLAKWGLTNYADFTTQAANPFPGRYERAAVELPRGANS